MMPNRARHDMAALTATATAAGIACSLAVPACAFGDVGFVERLTPDGMVTYFDFGGVGYIIVLVVALALMMRTQYKKIKRAEAQRKRREQKAGGSADPERAKEELGERTLAAVERLKQAEQKARTPKGRNGSTPGRRG